MALALFYVAGPLIIMVELLKPAVWIPVAILAPLWLVALDSFLFPAGQAGGTAARPGRPHGTKRIRLVVQAATLALSALWIYYSGIGSFTLCRADYIKHNFMFSSLVSQNLPIQISSDKSDFILHYYFSYYIIPTRIFDTLNAIFRGIDLNHVIFSIYTLALFLSLRVIGSCFRVSPLVVLLLFALAGGLDLGGLAALGGNTVVMGRMPIIDLPIYAGVEWWGEPRAPQSITANLYWAPQHFFAAVIGVALLGCIACLDRPGWSKLVHLFSVVTASAFWSPYVAVGLAALVLGGIAGRGLVPAARSGAVAWRKPSAGHIVAAGAFPLILFAFMAVFFAAAAPTSLPRSIFETATLPGWLLTYLLRHAPAILALGMLCGWPHGIGDADRAGGDRRELGWLIALCLAVEAVLLCFTHGDYNDWAMRTTLPVCMVLALAMARVLSGPMRVLPKALILGSLAASSAASLTEIGQSAFLPAQCAPYGRFRLEDLARIQDQYQGLPDSLLYRCLAREP